MYRTGSLGSRGSSFSSSFSSCCLVPSTQLEFPFDRKLLELPSNNTVQTNLRFEVFLLRLLSKGRSTSDSGWAEGARIRSTKEEMGLNRAHLAEFAAVLANARKITVLTGAGVSAESGIPTFRGEGGLWRNWNAMELATPEAFAENPSLVWEFYHYRRCVVSKAKPNAAHYALAALQQRCKQDAKQITLLTQNIDELHVRAGSKNLVELHGSLWKTRCTHCRNVQPNFDMPICAALDGRGAPDPATRDARIPSKDLPRCKLCNGLLRPHVVWFGETLEPQILDRANDALEGCDLLLVAGTSAVVWPAAGYAPMVSASGGTVAEFNLMDTPASRSCRFKFQGPSASVLPEALGIPADQLPRDGGQ